MLSDELLSQAVEILKLLGVAGGAIGAQQILSALLARNEQKYVNDASVRRDLIDARRDMETYADNLATQLMQWQVDYNKLHREYLDSERRLSDLERENSDKSFIILEKERIIGDLNRINQELKQRTQDNLRRIDELKLKIRELEERMVASGEG